MFTVLAGFKNVNTTKLDPTRTTMLRRAFMRDMARRFKLLQQDVTTLLVTDDVLGVNGNSLGVFNYDPDQERDEHGRWTSGGGGGSVGVYDATYPKAGKVVDGRTVLDEVPNLGSIDSSLDNPTELRGVREVLISAFEDSGPPQFYSKSERERTQRLAEAIQESGKISPLIVVIDKDGPYILEGGHRFDALKLNGAKSFPAVVVLDGGSLTINYDPDQPRDDQGRWTDGGGSKPPHEMTLEEFKKANNVSKETIGESIGAMASVGSFAHAGENVVSVEKDAHVYINPKGREFSYDIVKTERKVPDIVGKRLDTVRYIATAAGTDTPLAGVIYNHSLGQVVGAYNSEGKTGIIQKLLDRVRQDFGKVEGAQPMSAQGARAIHRNNVAFAIRTGKYVDDKVLADYPNLKRAITNAAETLAREAWRFFTSDEKLKAFNRWFKSKVQERVFTTDGPENKPWTAKYVDSAYRKGLADAWFKTDKSKLEEKLKLTNSTREQFLRSAFLQPEMVSKAVLLATRTYEELEGVTATMSQQMGRIVSEGIIRGDNPRQMARDMTRKIDGLTRQRALVIARTEVIHAHAEGTLDGFEELGIEDVNADVEWSTADDEKVCPLCESLEGVTMSIAEARGLIPRHPNCRCSWIPAFNDDKEAGQVWGAKGRQKAFKSSIRAERPGGSFRDALVGSSWLGKEKF